MHAKEVSEIESFLYSKLGEKHGLSDWCTVINQEGIIRRKLTRRELAFIFNRCLSFDLVKKSNYYQFLR
jgi:hypothetical protein